MDTNQEVEETFDGIKLKWTLRTIQKNNMHENYMFELSFHRKYVHKIHSSYIPYVVKKAKKIKLKIRERNLYTNQFYNGEWLWTWVPFTHPATFNTLAMDPILKRDIIEDLMKYMRMRYFYKRIGKAWKRGYLLYGALGTSKTSLITAIANFLEFDIYDLELTSVKDNYQLRKLLISTTKKSMIVIEDVDCSLDLFDRIKKNRKRNNINDDDDQEEDDDEEEEEEGGCGNFASNVSLSGVLNFTDGLWSSCGGERLMIFTTNHKEKLDPALLRPGRMDKHINLFYCELATFKMLAKNYLDIDEHEQMEEVEKMLPRIKMTPADVVEIFVGCNDDVDVGMKNLVKEMKQQLNQLLVAKNSSIAEEKNMNTIKKDALIL